LDRARGSVEKEKEDHKVFFFSVKKRSSVKRYVELVCMEELSKETTVWS
jgi:hypothetical protein